MNDTNDLRFRRVVAAVLGLSPEDVTDQTNPDTVDTWDSLNHINLISALEQEFRIMLPAASMGSAQSIPALKALLVEHGVQFPIARNP